MGPSETVHDDVRFLTGSPQRHAVLAALAETPARPTDLCERVDATRTTIQRVLAGFGERDWVTKRDGEYHLTLTGRRVFETYRELLDEVRRADEAGQLALHLGPAADDLPAGALETGDVVVGGERNPLAPVQAFTDWFDSVEGEVRAISPIVAATFNDVGADLLASGVDIEFVIDPSVLKQSAEAFPDALQRGLEHGGIDIYVHEAALDLGLAVDDGGCCLAAYDEENNLRALLVSDDERTREWALSVYERHRERSEPLADSLPS